MIVLSGALVLVALVLLVFGALDRNLPYVYGSIGVSLLSLLLLLVGIVQRRGELTGDEQDEATTPVTDTTDERVPALAGAGAQVESGSATVALPVTEPQPASRRVVPEPAPVSESEPVRAPEPVEAEAFEDELEELEDVADDDDFEDEDDEPAGSGVTVLVVSGRPRYHLEGCRVLRGKEPQPLDRDDARMHGFTPCGVCKPDADETEAEPDGAAPTAAGESFTETLFGGPLFADGPPAGDPEHHDDRAATSALPSRPVQPVLAEVDGPAEREPDDAPTDLRGDDPADDPTLEVADTPVVPAPDVAGDPDELPEPEDVPAAEAPAGAASDAGDDVEAAEAPVEGVRVAEVSGDEVSGDEALGGELPGDEVPEDEVPGDEVRAVEPVAEAVGSPPAVEDAPPVRARRKAARPAAPDEPAAAKKAAGKPATKKATAKKSPATKSPATKSPATKAPAKRTAAKKAAAAPPVEAPAAPKRPIVRAVRADALRLGATSAGSTTTRVAVRAAAPASAPPVVVVPDRDRFHRPECRYVRGVAGATTLPKAAATRQGYAACGVCKP